MQYARIPLQMKQFLPNSTMFTKLTKSLKKLPFIFIGEQKLNIADVISGGGGVEWKVMMKFNMHLSVVKGIRVSYSEVCGVTTKLNISLLSEKPCYNPTVSWTPAVQY